MEVEKKFKVFKSSAGSGKTYTLVKEYLKLCLREESPFVFSKILAITFTNKATYEMKSRIVSALKEISIGENIALTKQLSSELGIESKIIQSRSERVLISILHNYADFSISTIDRFSHRLIRTFSKDLKLPQNFQVELDEKELLQRVIGLLMEEVGKDEKISELILQYVIYQTEVERSWKIENDLSTFAQGMLKESSMPFLKALREVKSEDFKKLIALFSERNSRFEQQVETLGKEGLQLIDENGIKYSSFIGKYNLPWYFKKWIDIKVDHLQPSDTFRKNIENDKWYAKTCPSEQKSAIDGIAIGLKNHFERQLDFLENELPQYYGRAEVLKNVHQLMLLNQIEEKFSALKSEEQLLNISDFNKLISKVVLEEPMPFIYERLGEKYQHMMIDEFQDTSVLQFMNLLPLIEDSLAKGKENLIVGDAKQAIYRFRGGEVEQFAKMPDYIPDIPDENGLIQQRLITLKSQYLKKTLDKNYRSRKHLVGFNNSFFESLKATSNLSENVRLIFEGHEQEPHHQEDEGFVRLTFSDGKNEGMEEEILEKLKDSVDDCLTDNYSLKDITVLCRKKAQAKAVADFLVNQSIPVISSEVLLLNSSARINFLLDLARFTFRPKEDRVLKNIAEFFIQHNFLNVELSKAYEVVSKNSLSLSGLLEKVGLHLETDTIKSKSIYEFFESLSRTLNFTEGYDIYLQTFQDIVLEFQNSNSSNINSYLEWWEDHEHKLSLDIPDDLDAINVMTVHKSKGLEFPIVIYPFANQRVELSGPYKPNYLWTSLAEEDEIKVPCALVEFSSKLETSSFSEVFQAEKEKKQIDLVNDTYVAFTRASERFYIHSEQPSKSSSRLNLPRMLYDFASGKLKETTENTFEFGHKMLKDENKSSSAIPLMKVQNFSASWEEKLKISHESAMKWGDSDLSEQLKYGNLLHEILAKLNDAKEVDAVLLQMQYEGTIDQKELEFFQGKINHLLGREEIGAFFSSAQLSKREQMLVTKDSNLLRPDRVVYFQDEIKVLDFKTGEENETHQAQVINYVQAIQQTTNTSVRGYLLYTESERLVAV